MRILFLTNHLSGTDGWSRYSLDIIRGVKDQGHKVQCLVSRRSKQTSIKEYKFLRSPLEYLSNPLLSFLTARQLRKILKDFKPDIVHFLVEPYATILPFLRAKGTRTVLTCHGTYSVIPVLLKDPFKREISYRLSKRYYQKIDGVIAVSNYTKKHILKFFPELGPKIKVITNGINLVRYNVNLKRKSRSKVKKILFVGAVKPRKGILEALKACKYYQNNFSDNFIYDIVGECSRHDRYYQKLKKAVDTYGLSGKVFFRGKVSEEELEKYYREADLFLMLSLNIDNHFEGFGLVFLEANAKGIPVIGSKNCGAEEAISDGKTGYLVNPYSFEEVAAKIDMILDKNSIDSRNCVNWAKQHDIKIKAKEMIEFYKTL